MARAERASGEPGPPHELSHNRRPRCNASKVVATQRYRKRIPSNLGASRWARWQGFGTFRKPTVLRQVAVQPAAPRMVHARENGGVSREIDWKSLPREEFERIVELLLLRECAAPGRRVEVPDGRGGDGGMDVAVYDDDSGELLEIYQLKYFPDGFAGNSGRRTQISRSFTTAMGHRPRVWTLVTPGNLTPGERRSVGSLPHDYPVIIRSIGRVELDDLLAKHADVQSFAMRDAQREALQLVGRESAAMATADDLIEEAARIKSAGGALSPYWSPRITIDGGTQTLEWMPLRADSREKEPLTWQAQLDFTGHEPLRDAFGRIFDWGSDESLVLPPAVVRQVDRLGPDWFRGTDREVFLELGRSADDLNESVGLELARGGELISSHTGTITYRASGSRGATIVMCLHGGLSITWVLPREMTARTTTQIKFDASGQTGRVARRAARFLDDLGASDRVDLVFEQGRVPLVVAGDESFSVDSYLSAFLDDLAVIEASCDVDFSVPDLVPVGEERIWVRVARQLLDGKHVAIPFIGKTNFVLSGHETDRVLETLSGPHWVRKTIDSYKLTLLGVTVDLGRVSLLNILLVDNPEEVRAAISAGDPAGCRMVMRATDPPRAYTVHRGFDDGPIPLVSRWDLEEFEEHPHLNFQAGEGE